MGTPHNGHRERLRTKFKKDPSLLEDHELFELLLFFSIPRVNTNEIAHELLDKFGSVKGILDTGLNKLQDVGGLGENSALLLRVVSEMTARYAQSQYRGLFKIDSHATLSGYLQSLFIGAENETSYILLLDNSKHILACEKISEGTPCTTSACMQKIATLAMAYKASAVILAHNHPNGRSIPSGNDILATSRVRSALAPFSIELAEHFIVAGNECLPIINSQKAHLYELQPNLAE